MRRLLILVLIGFTHFIQAQTAQDFLVLKGEYLGQKPPGIIPEVFVPELILGKRRLHCFPYIVT